MRLEFTRAGLLVLLANYYTTRGAPEGDLVMASNCSDIDAPILDI